MCIGYPSLNKYIGFDTPILSDLGKKSEIEVTHRYTVIINIKIQCSKLLKYYFGDVSAHLEMIHLSYSYREQLFNKSQKLSETQETLANLRIFIN